MYIVIFLEILVSFFAVVGIWSFFKLTLGKVTAEKNYIIAIEILTQRDAESAEVLIRRALCQYFIIGRGRVAVITSHEIAENIEFKKIIQKYGVELLVL